MATATPNFLNLPKDGGDLTPDHHHDEPSHRQSQDTHRHRDVRTLVPIWFDEFDDFIHSDPEPLADHQSDLHLSQSQSLHPVFTVNYEDDDDAIEEAYDSGLIRIIDDVSDTDSGGLGQIFHRESQVSFVMDLFQDRMEQRSEFGVFDFGLIDDDGDGGIEESNYLDLNLGLGLEPGFDVRPDYYLGEYEDDFFFGTRRNWRRTDDGGGGDESVRVFGSSLGVVDEMNEADVDVSDLSSADEEYEFDYFSTTVDDVSFPFCWDSLQFEDYPGRRDGDEELEWEEVREGGIEELERDVLNMVLDGEEDDDVDAAESVTRLRSDDAVAERVVTGWEVLLNAEDMNGTVELADEDPYFGPGGYLYTDEQETMFGHFTESEVGVMGKPPTSKTVVENLDVVVITELDVENNNTVCAVCKDEMNVREEAKRLPCSHKYHGDCIAPWLGIRNTCPVCRFELPTDDAEYERRKTLRAGRGQ